MRPAPQRLIEKVAFLGLGLALGYLAAAQPTWAGPRQPGSAPHEHGRPDHAAAPPTRASLRQPSTMPIAWMPPPGTVHTFSNRGAGDARLLVIISPAGFERAFEEMAEVAPSAEQPPDMDRLMAIAREYNLEIVGPPPG